MKPVVEYGCQICSSSACASRNFGPYQDRTIALAIEMDKASNQPQRAGATVAGRITRGVAAWSRSETNHHSKRKGCTMTTAIIFHEVQDGDVWAKAWKKGPGSRHEMFGKLGIKCRNFRDPDNPNATGIMAEIPDMGRFRELLRSDEGQKAMREDGLKVDTMRMLVEFTP